MKVLVSHYYPSYSNECILGQAYLVQDDFNYHNFSVEFYSNLKTEKPGWFRVNGILNGRYYRKAQRELFKSLSKHPNVTPVEMEEI